MTTPKMVCLLSSHGVGPTVMKNCDPLVPGPVLAIASRYGRSKAQLGVDLVLELVARAARALAERVAALDHELGDDPVEHRAVVELLLGGRPGRGSVHSLPPSASSTKFRTVFGAWSGNSRTVIVPWLVVSVAVSVSVMP